MPMVIPAFIDVAQVWLTVLQTSFTVLIYSILDR